MFPLLLQAVREHPQQERPKTPAQAICSFPRLRFQQVKEKVLRQIGGIPFIESFPPEKSVHGFPIPSAKLVQSAPRFRITVKGRFGQLIPTGGRKLHGAKE
jgi:hypothetical protein